MFTRSGFICTTSTGFLLALSCLDLTAALWAFCRTLFTLPMIWKKSLNIYNQLKSNQFTLIGIVKERRHGTVRLVLISKLLVLSDVVSLSKKLYPYCLVLAGSRNGFEHDFTIVLNQIEGLMEDWLKCQIRPLVKYRQNPPKNTGTECSNNMRWLLGLAHPNSWWMPVQFEFKCSFFPWARHFTLLLGTSWL